MVDIPFFFLLYFPTQIRKCPYFVHASCIFNKLAQSPLLLIQTWACHFYVSSLFSWFQTNHFTFFRWPIFRGLIVCFVSLIFFSSIPHLLSLWAILIDYICLWEVSFYIDLPKSFINAVSTIFCYSCWFYFLQLLICCCCSSGENITFDCICDVTVPICVESYLVLALSFLLQINYPFSIFCL